MLTLALSWEVATIAVESRMSVLNQSGEEPVECPLCMEPLEVDDLHFYPCTCGYQICRFCWNRIREGENGLCPACRKAYPENPADFTPLSQEQVAAIKTEKKAREQKRRNKTLESRRALANVRVVQKNLVFVVGLPVRLADPEILKRQEYFGKYGKIHKVVINQNNTYAGTQPSGSGAASASAYVTYVSVADALRAIQGVNNVPLDGRVLKGSLGTTKYCANFMKNQPCPKPDCMYLHELGDPKASFTKEEMHAGLHQVYERKLHNQLLQASREKPEDKSGGSGNSSTNGDKSNGKDGTQSNFIPTTVVTSSNINVVNSSKSKKEQNGNGSNGNGNGGNGKEAWPSLGSSPPSDSPARKQSSPKPQSTVKSQENGTSSTSESSSPTQLEPQLQAQKKNTESKSSRKESTNQKKKDKSKQKSNNITVSNTDDKADKTIDYNGETFKNSESYKASETFKPNEFKNAEFTNSEFKNSEFTNSEFKNNEYKNSEFKNNDYKNSEFKNDYKNSEFKNNDYKSSEFKNDYKNSEFKNNDYKSSEFKNNDYKNSEFKNNEYKNSEFKNNEYKNSELKNSEAYNDKGYTQNVFENETYLTNELDELESDRHSLLENHDLLDNSDHSLLDDDNTHNLLNDANNEVLLMQRHREMMAGLVDNKHMLIKNPMLNGYGMIDRDMGFLDRHSQMNSQGLEKEMRERSQSEMMMRQSEMLARQHSAMVEPKHYMPSSSIGMENASELLGANYHQNSNMLPPFGMRVDTPMSNSMGTMSNMGSSMSNMGSSMSNMPGMASYMLHNQQMMNQQMPNGLVNGFDAQTNEGRYLAENMDKFFTDFHKAQQLRLQLNRGPDDRRQHFPHNMLSAERLEMEHKQRLSAGGAGSGRAAGDGDDDLDFDPFKETQKAFAELMETELIHNQNQVSGDNIERVRRTRMAPPGFAHPNNSFGLPAQRNPQHGFMSSTNTTASYSDWTQMDPAIMSVNFTKSQPPTPAPLAPPPHELFARFAHTAAPPNGLAKPHAQPQWQPKMPWTNAPFNSIPLPPGFAPPKAAQHPTECIESK